MEWTLLVKVKENGKEQHAVSIYSSSSPNCRKHQIRLVFCHRLDLSKLVPDPTQYMWDEALDHRNGSETTQIESDKSSVWCRYFEDPHNPSLLRGRSVWYHNSANTALICSSR